jgi:hypothetical protein
MINTASYTVQVKGQTVTFSSALTELQVKEILATLTSSFARDLYRKFNKLSEKQYAWAVKMAQDKIAVEAQLQDQGYDFSGLVQMIQTAKDNGLKRIKVRLGDVILKPSKDDRVYVCSATEMQDGMYGPQPKFLGWIKSNQTTLRNQDIINELEDAALDPTRAAKVHGQRTGTCACCGRELTNSLSIQMGIGPICAERFGL